MGSPELAQYADFYADTTDRFALTDNLSLWRDISERLHQLTSEPEDVTYRDVTANGVPAILVMPAGLPARGRGVEGRSPAWDDNIWLDQARQ